MNKQLLQADLLNLTHMQEYQVISDEVNRMNNNKDASWRFEAISLYFQQKGTHGQWF